jgi:hypothetical protein
LLVDLKSVAGFVLPAACKCKLLLVLYCVVVVVKVDYFPPNLSITATCKYSIWRENPVFPAAKDWRDGHAAQQHTHSTNTSQHFPL